MVVKEGEKKISRWSRKLREKGLREILVGRYRRYKQSFQMDNWPIGRLVELVGNRVKMHGLVFSVDNPLVATRHKSTLYFGLYEKDEIELARHHLDPELPTIELGGSIGVVACVTNKLLRRPTDHVVVEANPVLLPTLEKNRDLNGCQFTIKAAALGYGADVLSFTVTDHFLFGRAGAAEGRTVSVPTVSVGELIRSHGFESINLISDIEGAEVELVENESEVLRARVKRIIMEVHPDQRGSGPIAGMLAALGRIGFETSERSTPTVVALINRGL